MINCRIARALALCAGVAIPMLLSTTASAQASGYVTMSDSARIFYRVAGRPGPGIDTLIALHGGPGMDLESIYGDFEAEFGRKHVVIFYDQRGGGKSELPTDTLRLVAARQIQDLEEIRRHFGLRQLILVAHSYGPLLAASYAIVHPDKVRKMGAAARRAWRAGDDSDGPRRGVGNVDAQGDGDAAQGSRRGALYLRREARHSLEGC